jgi:hypothetical protein
MATITEQGGPLEFVLHEANGWRSRDRAIISLLPAGHPPVILPPGTLLRPDAAVPGQLIAVMPGLDGTGAPDVDSANAILGYPTDVRTAVQEATVISRDCEVNAAYLRYMIDPALAPPAGELDPVTVAGALALQGIIVRESILPSPEVVMNVTQPPLLLQP